MVKQINSKGYVVDTSSRNADFEKMKPSKKVFIIGANASSAHTLNPSINRI